MSEFIKIKTKEYLLGNKGVLFLFFYEVPLNRRAAKCEEISPWNIQVKKTMEPHLVDTQGRRSLRQRFYTSKYTAEITL